MTLARENCLPDCRCYLWTEPCDRCHRLHQIGLLVDALVMLPITISRGQGLVPGPQYLRCLDAIAYLLVQSRTRPAFNVDQVINR